VLGVCLGAVYGGRVGRVRRAASVPVCVGFGIGSPQQARAVAQIADRVIVGSACVQAIGQSQAPVDAAKAFARIFKESIQPVSFQRHLR